LRDRYEDVKARGAEIVAIGQGFPEMAADFKRKRKIPFPLLVDRDRVSYKAMGLPKGSVMDAFAPHMLARGTLSFVKGHPQGLTPEGSSVKQLGGVLVVDRGGKVLLAHQSKDASDNLSVEVLIAALPNRQS
jgi:hypothetical protein